MSVFDLSEPITQSVAKRKVLGKRSQKVQGGGIEPRASGPQPREKIEVLCNNQYTILDTLISLSCTI